MIIFDYHRGPDIISIAVRSVAFVPRVTTVATRQRQRNGENDFGKTTRLDPGRTASVFEECAGGRAAGSKERGQRAYGTQISVRCRRTSRALIIHPAGTARGLRRASLRSNQSACAVRRKTNTAVAIPVTYVRTDGGSGGGGGGKGGG